MSLKKYKSQGKAVEVTVNSLRLLSGFRPRIRPQGEVTGKDWRFFSTYSGKMHMENEHMNHKERRENKKRRLTRRGKRCKRSVEASLRPEDDQKRGTVHLRFISCASEISVEKQMKKIVCDR